SIQLNCSLDCPDGKPQWKGLDTNLGNIISTPTYSLLLVTNAAVAMEGMKFCMGNSCRSSCAILFSALPDTLQLETQPRELVAGQPAHLHCSISKVYPPGSLTLSWYRGDQRLESPDPEEAADDEELFSYDSELEVPGEKVTEGMEFRCEVELLLPSDRSFHRATAVAVRDVASTENPTTGDVASTENSLTKKATSAQSPRTVSVCNLQIRPVPSKGTTGEALKIICEAECGEDITIRWLKTPVELSQYQEEASKSKSILTVDHVDLNHQGIYECVMLSRRLQVASLHIAVSAGECTDSAIAIGTASSLLGLIVTAFVSHHLWRRLHPPGMRSPKGNSV
uniref:Ig-like domain-containing protein n=1 Tax=Gopherus evgoodei TaxID=1825980 RepID=A0A8C4XYP7_9SAUR